MGPDELKSPNEIPPQWNNCTIQGNEESLSSLEAAALSATCPIADGYHDEDNWTLSLTNGDQQGGTSEQFETAFESFTNRFPDASVEWNKD